MSESTGGVLSIVSNWQISLEQIKDQIQNKSVKRRKRKNMAWYDSAVFYHIYPLGLCGCSKENTGIAEAHFDQLKQWAKHACDMGFTAIYIGPLFESVGHGYETTDYKKVDIRLGTNEDFRDFVDYCHGMGVKVVVDGVFNHVGRRFFAFEDLQKNREGSPYRDWFCNVNFGANNEYNDGFSYENWGGYNLLVKLNQRNPEVMQYLFDVIRFWIDTFDIDGIRLDAADVLDFDFMKRMRYETSRMKEDFWLMGEVIHGDYSRWVNDETLHCVTNYELHKGLYSGHNDHNYFEIAHTIRRLNDICRGGCLYTFADNHDVERIYTKLNQKEHLKLVTLLVYTLYGIPSVYYGSEFGIEGNKEQGSDWNLRPYLDLSDFADAEKTNPVTALCARLGAMKKEYPELTYGEYKELHLTNRQFAYGRVLDGNCIVTALNCDDAPADMEFGVPADGNVTDLLGCSENVRYENGRISVTLPANTGTVLYIGQKKVEEPEDTAWKEQTLEAEPDAPDMEAAGISEQELSQTAEEAEKPEAAEQTVSSESVKSDSIKPRISGIVLMTEDMGRMIEFYRNALEFNLEMQGSRAYFEKDGIILTMAGRRDYERLTCRGYGYGGGVNNHFHLRITVNDVDTMHQKCLGCGAQQVTAPGNNEWGEYTSCVADPDGNIIELVKENDRG